MQVLKSVQTKNNNTIDLIGDNSKAEFLVIGVFHGDEPQGKLLIDNYLKEEIVNSNILFIPCLNPDGMALNTRVNSNNVDLNRNFPTKNWGLNQGDNATCDDITTAYYGGKYPASEIETKFVIDIIEEYEPKAIITLHAPYKVVNYDGPAKDLALKISDIIHYPVEGSIGYPTPGSFGTYCGVERNIPTITLELDENAELSLLYPKIKQIFSELI